MHADADGNIILPSGVWGRVDDGAMPNEDMFVTTFRLQREKTPNTVFVDIPVRNINENVLGAIGIDDVGRRWILRQGLLRENGELGGVNLDEFHNHTTFLSVEVEPPPKNQDRRYYVIACVDEPTEAVQSATAAFVLECDHVRRSKYNMLAASEVAVDALSRSIRLADGSPETRLSYSRSPADAQVIIRRQTNVWQALKKLLGSRMSNPVIERLAMDALIERRGELPLLVEIKTDNGATAIQQGFGQLLLYAGLYPDPVEMVLLLPKAIRPELERILTRHSIVVATYENIDQPKFHGDFLKLCRV
jgi:hypothetical protein